MKYVYTCDKEMDDVDTEVFDAWGTEVEISSFASRTILQSFLERVEEVLKDEIDGARDRAYGSKLVLEDSDLLDGSDRREVLDTGARQVGEVRGLRFAYEVFQDVLHDMVWEG